MIFSARIFNDLARKWALTIAIGVLTACALWRCL